MNCIRCGAEMNSATGGNYTCPKCGMGVNDLVYRTQNCDVPYRKVLECSTVGFVLNVAKCWHRGWVSVIVKV